MNFQTLKIPFLKSATFHGVWYWDPDLTTMQLYYAAQARGNKSHELHSISSQPVPMLSHDKLGSVFEKKN